ncbi:MAG: PAS domain S-box protein [Cyanobacteria bacterium SID2]|nr:PAS domain S-box protein [Cyanobacteria bacterium SID2]
MRATRASRDERPQNYRGDLSSGDDRASISWHRSIARVARQIQQSIALSEILQTTVDEIYQQLGCDRVFLYQLEPDCSGRVVVEAVSAPQWSLLDRVMKDTCFEASWTTEDRKRQFSAIEDITTADISLCHVELLTEFQVKANLVVPIFHGERLWGLSIAHSCNGPRQWKVEEIEGLQEIAVHVGIAIHQASLIEQLQAAKAKPESPSAVDRPEREQTNKPLQEAVRVAHPVTVGGIEQQDFLRQVLDSLFTFVGVLTPEGIVLEVNQAPLVVAGLTREDIIGQPFANTYWWSYSSKAKAQIQAAIDRAQKGMSVRFDIPIRVHGGSQRVVDFSLTPLKDSADNITHLIPSGIDITERKRGEAECRQAVDRIKQQLLAIESSVDGIAILREGAYQYLNPSHVEMFGYDSAEELLGRSWQYLYSAEELARFQKEVFPILEANRHWQGEAIATRKDGSTFYEEVSLTLSGDSDLICVCRDVTARKQADIELRESKEQLEDFFDNASDLIQSVSLKNGRFLYVNRTWLNTLGYELDDLAELTVFDLIAPDCIPQCQSIFKQLQSGEVRQVKRLEVTFLAKDRCKILLEGSINVRVENETPIATRSIFHDITAQRKVENLLREQAKVLKIFYETSPLIMGVVELSDDDILHIYHNPATLNFFGISPEDITYKWASELGVSRGIIQLWITHYRQSQKQQKPIQFDYEHQIESGTYWLLGTVSFLGFSESNRPQFSYIVQDITDRKRSEDERRRADAIQLQADRVSGELKLLENILEITLAGYWDWNIPSNQEYLSPSFKQMFGYEDFELPNSPETWQKLIFSEDLPEALTCFERHVQSHGNIPYSIEVRYRHKDGSTVWVICSGQVIEWDTEGNPLRMIGCHIDITDRKRTEETLRKSEATNRALIEAIPDVLIRMRQDGVPLEVINEEAVLDIHTRENIDRSSELSIADIMPFALDRDRVRLAQAALQTGSIERQEYDFVKGEQTYYEEARIIPLWRDEVLVVIRDITLQKQAEIELKTTKSQLELFIQATSEGFFDWDLITGKVYLSPRWKEMLGYADDELENAFETWESLVFEEDRVAALQLIEDYNNGKVDRFSMTQRIRHKNGSTVYIFVRAIHIKNDRGDVVRMIGSHLDMTQMVAMQEALKTSEMQLSSILNSSLDGIMAFRSVRNDRDKIVDFEWLLSNPTACEIVGRSANDLIGQRLLQELPAHREEGLFDLYVRVVESGEPIQRQFHYNHEGIDCWFEHIAVKLGDGFAVTFRNISAIKQSEQALQQANHQLEDHLNDLKQRNTEMLLLSETSDFLQACFTIEEACAVISSLVEPLFPGCSGGIFITNASRNRVENATSWGAHLHSQPDFPPQDCWALRRGRLHWVGQHRAGLRCKHVSSHAELSDTLCIPTIAQGETLGLFYLSAETPEALPEAKRQLACTVAEQIALSIANLRLRETLQNQSIRDPLTGLFNRRYLKESLQQEIARAQRNQHSIGVIMLDVDRFKQFNDTYGHEAGDYVLQSIGKLLRESVRGSDIACRYGGEEMTLVLPECSLVDARARAEAIREGISQLRIHYQGKMLDVLTASLGVACFPQHGVTGQVLLQAADTALYRAKAEGRNRVVVAP